MRFSLDAVEDSGELEEGFLVEDVVERGLLEGVAKFRGVIA